MSNGHEEHLIERLKSVYENHRKSSTLVGIGDDAAVLGFDGNAVVSVDSALEDVHFRRAWFAPATGDARLDWEELGYHSLAAAMSDLSAMGARPVSAFSSLVLPYDFPEEALLRIARGQTQLGLEADIDIAGGNINFGPVLHISTTVVGCASNCVLRSSAQPGDIVYVSGTLGAAALALHLLEHSHEALDPLRYQAWSRPPLRGALGLALAQSATSMMDLSDGLLVDATRLAKQSKVQLRINAASLPLVHESDWHRAQSESKDASKSRLDLALLGGEDYELLFTLPANVQSPRACTAIGSIHEGEGVIVLR